MTYKSFIVLIILSVLTSGAIAFISVATTKASTYTAEPMKQREYVNIGNGIRRTDDHEKGISCYVASGGSMSCVKVNP